MPQYSVFPQLVIFSSKGREDGCVSSGGAGAGRGVCVGVGGGTERRGEWGLRVEQSEQAKPRRAIFPSFLVGPWLKLGLTRIRA